jgi:hypothetical protein
MSPWTELNWRSAVMWYFYIVFIKLKNKF